MSQTFRRRAPASRAIHLVITLSASHLHDAGCSDCNPLSRSSESSLHLRVPPPKVTSHPATSATHRHSQRHAPSAGGLKRQEFENWISGLNIHTHFSDDFTSQASSLLIKNTGSGSNGVCFTTEIPKDPNCRGSRTTNYHHIPVTTVTSPPLDFLRICGCFNAACLHRLPAARSDTSMQRANAQRGLQSRSCIQIEKILDSLSLSFAGFCPRCTPPAPPAQKCRMITR